MASRQGQILLASREMDDPHFHRTAVLIVQHNEDGAMGLILNRPLDVSVRDAWEQLGEGYCQCEGVLRYGGPCDGPLLALHGHADQAQLDVLAGLYLTADSDQLSKLAQKGDNSVRFYAGYSGWGPAQLEAELATGSWLLVPGDASLVFSDDPELWTLLLARVDRAMGMLERNPKLLPPDPSLN
ncbi:MAG: YqgE/AlgH family protein [Phycisphaeraceae bacterium]|nr:YqgE/AlgH family protein [Phycisphaeraceae bacterium]